MLRLWLLKKMYQIMYPPTKCKYLIVCPNYHLKDVVCNEYNDEFRSYCGKFRRLAEVVM